MSWLESAIMQLFIARENLKRFKKQLEGCSDPVQRTALVNLIVAEEAHLRLLLGTDPSG